MLFGIRMPNVPAWIGHKYLGPGNPYPNGEAVDKADEVAKAHDKFYTDLLAVADKLDDEEFRAKVAEADWKAVSDFIRNFSEDGHHYDWFSAAGAAGLSIKATVEQLIGRIIYPKKSSVTGNGNKFFRCCF